MAYVEVLDEKKATTAVGFLRRAVAHFATYGIRIGRVMSDNGPVYRSTIDALACRTLRIRHLRTRPYRPQTNGKAERFIRTLLGGWAYGAIYGSSTERTRALTGWLSFYNRSRPHGSLGRQPPLARLEALMNERGWVLQLAMHFLERPPISPRQRSRRHRRRPLLLQPSRRELRQEQPAGPEPPPPQPAGDAVAVGPVTDVADTGTRSLLIGIALAIGVALLVLAAIPRRMVRAPGMRAALVDFGARSSRSPAWQRSSESSWSSSLRA